MLACKFLIVLLQLALISGAKTPNKDVNLEALHRNEKVELTSLSQVSSLVAQIGHSSQTLRQNAIFSALLDFQDVIEVDRESVCTMNKIEKYERYYLKYLKSPKHAKDFRPLPNSLRKLVLAYGLQLANVCKWNIYNELETRVKSLLTDEDFEPMMIHIHDKSALTKFIGAPRYPDELLLPVDLLGEKLAGEQSEWVLNRGLARSNLEKLKESCERQFRPIYEPLMLPVARLARLGFNYRDEQLKRKSSDKKIFDKIGRWPRVVFLCELVKNIKLMSLEEAKEMEIQQDKLVVLSDDELDEISALDSELILSDREVWGIQYNSLFQVRIGDLVLDPANKRLIKAVASFKTDRSTEKILRQRRRSSLFGIIKSHLKHFRIRSAVTKWTKHIWNRVDFWSGLKDERQELVKGLEQELVRDEPKPKLTFTRFISRGVIALIKLTMVTVIMLFVICMFVC